MGHVNDDSKVMQSERQRCFGCCLLPDNRIADDLFDPCATIEI